MSNVTLDDKASIKELISYLTKASSQDTYLQHFKALLNFQVWDDSVCIEDAVYDNSFSLTIATIDAMCSDNFPDTNFSSLLNKYYDMLVPANSTANNFIEFLRMQIDSAFSFSRSNSTYLSALDCLCDFLENRLTTEVTKNEIEHYRGGHFKFYLQEDRRLKQLLKYQDNIPYFYLLRVLHEPEKNFQQFSLSIKKFFINVVEYDSETIADVTELLCNTLSRLPIETIPDPSITAVMGYLKKLDASDNKAMIYRIMLLLSKLHDCECLYQQIWDFFIVTDEGYIHPSLSELPWLIFGLRDLILGDSEYSPEALQLWQGLLTIQGIQENTLGLSTFYPIWIATLTNIPIVNEWAVRNSVKHFELISLMLIDSTNQERFQYYLRNELLRLLISPNANHTKELLNIISNIKQKRMLLSTDQAKNLAIQLHLSVNYSYEFNHSLELLNLVFSSEFFSEKSRKKIVTQSSSITHGISSQFAFIIDSLVELAAETPERNYQKVRMINYCFSQLIRFASKPAIRATAQLLFDNAISATNFLLFLRKLISGKQHPVSQKINRGQQLTGLYLLTKFCFPEFARIFYLFPDLIKNIHQLRQSTDPHVRDYAKQGLHACCQKVAVEQANNTASMWFSNYLHKELCQQFNYELASLE
jgi:hypothetical protein